MGMMESGVRGVHNKTLGRKLRSFCFQIQQRLENRTASRQISTVGVDGDALPWLPGHSFITNSLAQQYTAGLGAFSHLFLRHPGMVSASSHLHSPSAVQRENPEWLTPGFITKIPELGLVRADSSIPVLSMTCSHALPPFYNSQHKNFRRALTMAVPIPGDVAPMSKISRIEGKKTPNNQDFGAATCTGTSGGSIWV